MSSKMSSIYLLCLIIFLVSACSSTYDKNVVWKKVSLDSFPVLYAIGYAPISLQKSKHETQRMLLAVKASKIAAFAELAEQVYGQRIDGKTTMANLLINNQQLSSSINGIIRGAKIIKTYPLGDTYVTELELNYKEVHDMYLQSTPAKSDTDVKSYYLNPA